MRPLIGRPVSSMNVAEWDAFLAKRVEMRAVRVGKRRRQGKITLGKLAREMQVAKPKIRSIIIGILEKEKLCSKDSGNE
jgi:hypothetical protein